MTECQNKIEMGDEICQKDHLNLQRQEKMKS